MFYVTRKYSICLARRLGIPQRKRTRILGLSTANFHNFHNILVIFIDFYLFFFPAKFPNWEQSPSDSLTFLYLTLRRWGREFSDIDVSWTSGAPSLAHSVELSQHPLKIPDRQSPGANRGQEEMDKNPPFSGAWIS